MSKTVFLSYARADLASARRLVADLRADDVRVWFDKDSLIPGQRWRNEIERVIHESDYFLALLSINSVNKRGFVQAELATAVSVLTEVPPEHIFLIPARLDDCRVSHPRLRDLHRVDLFPEWNSGVAEIRRAVLGTAGGTPTDAARLPDAPEYTLDAKPELVRWGPPDGLPPGIWINSRNGPFVPWHMLKVEIEQRLLNQGGRKLPPGCTVAVRDHFGRKDWTVRIIGPGGNELGHVWFGGDPLSQWRFDGLVRIGRPFTDQVAEVWQTFQRFSDGSYRRVGLVDSTK